VRKNYIAIKSGPESTSTLKRFQARDHLLDPQRSRHRADIVPAQLSELKLLRKRNEGVNGLSFGLTHDPEDHNFFFSAHLRNGILSLNINQCHPFYSVSYRQLNQESPHKSGNAAQHVLLLLVSFARAEFV